MNIINISKNILIFMSVYLCLNIVEGTVEFSSYNQLQDTDIKALYIYDTSSDVDTVWPKDNTKSWYKESGPFPKVAYLILSNSGLDILDANTKTTWMQFYKGSNHLLPKADYNSVTALDGKILLGTNTGLVILDFKADSAKWFTNNNNYFSLTNIAERNDSIIWRKGKGNTTPHDSIHDAAITNIGGAEYAALATDKGVAIINLTTNAVYRGSGSLGVINAVAFGNNDLYYGGSEGLHVKYDIDSLNRNWASPDFSYKVDSSPKITGNTVNDIAVLPGRSTASFGNNTIFAATNNGITEIQEHQFLPILSIETHWTDEILSADNISCVTTDGSSLWAGASFGIDEIKLFNKTKLYKTYTVDSSPSIINNNITSLSGNGLAFVGTPSGCTVLDEPWWNTPGYKYRQQLLITNNSINDLEESYSVSFTFNHAELVDSGKSLASGDDVRIIFYDGNKWTELDRVLEPDNIWFKTKAIIPKGVKDSRYYLYYGNPKAVNPPADKNNVFLFWEDFEDDSIDQPPTGWSNDSGDEFIVVKSISNRLRKYRYISSENDITIDNTAGIDNFELSFLTSKLTNNNSPSNKIGILFHSGEDNNGYRILLSSDGAVLLQDENFKPVPATVANFNFLDDTDHRVTVQVFETTLKVFWDSSEVLKANISKGFGKIGFFNDNGFAIGGPEIDEIYLRKYIEKEPTVLSNNIEMTNIPTGDIISAEQIRSDYVDIKFTVDSPYDQVLKAKLEWSINPTIGFQKCYILTGNENIASNYPDSFSKPAINNISAYQIENIPTSNGPNRISVKWLPASSAGFPLNTINTYWLRLTVNNDSCDQEVPDIISLTIDTRSSTSQESSAGTGELTSTTSASTAITTQMQISQEGQIGYIEEQQISIQPVYLGPQAKLAFITPPQTIVVNTASNVIIVQIQDINDNPLNASQDIIIELSTTSGAKL